MPSALHVGHAELERVAAGHVVRGEAHVVLMVRGVGEHVGGAVQRSQRQLELGDDGVGPVSVVQIGLGTEDPRLAVEGEVAFEQDPVWSASAACCRHHFMPSVAAFAREIHRSVSVKCARREIKCGSRRIECRETRDATELRGA